MRYTISHQGVPVGTVDLEPQPEVMACTVEPLAGYAAIAALVQAASALLLERALLNPTAASTPTPAVGDRTLERAAALGRALELRDAEGALVATDFIELVEAPSPEVPLAAFVSFRAVAAGVQATKAPTVSRGSEAASLAP